MLTVSQKERVMAIARRSRWPLVLAALSLVAAACSPTARTAPTKGGSVDVSLNEFKITPSGDAPVGSPFELKVHNDGAIVHSMAIEVAGKTFSTPILNPGRSATLSVPSLAAGSYKLWCTVPGHREAGMEATLATGSEAETRASTSPEAMEQAEEAAIKAFPAKTEGLGGRVLAPQIAGGVKVFDLTAKSVRWEVSPGQFVDGYGYNGQIPGPEIRVHRGDKIRVVLHNALSESTVVHFHGLTVPNAMDGVPFITQPPVKRGQAFTYAFTVVDPPGAYMYHSHMNALEQVGKGLLGAFVVEPKTPAWDIEQALVLGDGPLGYTINGKGFPATAPVVAPLGKRVLIRFMNAGQLLHPMHLHGYHFRVLAEDGRPVTPRDVDSLVVAPGERYDVSFVANAPGVWAFHCHILRHVDSGHGMFGMVTAVIVK